MDKKIQINLERTTFTCLRFFFLVCTSGEKWQLDVYYILTVFLCGLVPLHWFRSSFEATTSNFLFISENMFFYSAWMGGTCERQRNHRTHYRATTSMLVIVHIKRICNKVTTAAKAATLQRRTHMDSIQFSENSTCVSKAHTSKVSQFL